MYSVQGFPWTFQNTYWNLKNRNEFDLRYHDLAPSLLLRLSMLQRHCTSCKTIRPKSFRAGEVCSDLYFCYPGFSVAISNMHCNSVGQDAYGRRAFRFSPMRLALCTRRCGVGWLTSYGTLPAKFRHLDFVSRLDFSFREKLPCETLMAAAN